jgi:Fic family protein
LRWHPALRKGMGPARVEALVRGARASAALDGADLPLDQVRGLLAVDGSRPEDVADLRPDQRVALGALRAGSLAGELAAVLATAPAQALARLHLAATGLPPDPLPAKAFDAGEGLGVIGRPRGAGVRAVELVDLGAAPSGAELAARLDSLSALLIAPTDAPALVLAAVVHGELLALRPFTSGNGLVARAVSRALIQGRGLDPTAVAVPEVGHLAGGTASYIGMAAAYASGTVDGVRAWILHCAKAVELGAREGVAVADTVLSGRLGH